MGVAARSLSASLLPLLAAIASASTAQAACVHDWLFCTITQVCDGAGACEADDTRVDFSLPASAGQDTAQGTTFCIDDVPVSTISNTAVYGITQWQDGDTVNRLLPAGQHEMLWVSHDAEPSANTTKIRFMTCGMLE